MTQYELPDGPGVHVQPELTKKARNNFILIHVVCFKIFLLAKLTAINESMTKTANKERMMNFIFFETLTISFLSSNLFRKND